MKTLILYASKYGAAEEIARRIAREMSDAVVHDLKQGGIPPIADFDCVIIGSSVYAGSVRKEAKTFVAKNADVLGQKRLGLFISGFAKDDKYFATNYPQSLLDKVKAKGFLGGIFDPKKAGGFERLIIKIVMKQNSYVDSIDGDAISKFVEELYAK